MTVDHLIIFVAWSVYYCIHSVLVTDGVKTRIRNVGISLTVWRIIYSILSVLGLVGVLLLIATTKSELMWPLNNVSRFFGMVFATYGVIIVRVSFRNYSLKEFLMRDDRFDEGSELKVIGIQEKIRHPLYSGTILILIGMMFFVPKFSSLVTVIVTFLYLPIGIWLEEKKLIRKFGNQYLEYKNNVPALIPKFW